MYVIAGYTVDLSALLVRHEDDGDHDDDRNGQPNNPEQRVLPPSEIRRPGLPRHDRIIAPARRLSSARSPIPERVGWVAAGPGVGAR